MTKTSKKPLAVCPKCGEAIEFELPDGRRVAVMCKCRRQTLEQAKQQQHTDYIAELQARIPQAYRRCTFDKDDQQDAETTKILKRYTDQIDIMLQNGQGLLLCGDVGTGKTYGAMCVANALATKGYRVGCTTLSKIISNAQDWNNAEYWFNEVLSNQVIVIDDLGTQRTTEFANEQVYEFIDECTKQNRCLIITTNLVPSMFQAAIDKAKTENDLAFARIYSRILERCYPVRVNAVKRRANNQAERKQTMRQLLGGGNV